MGLTRYVVLSLCVLQHLMQGLAFPRLARIVTLSRTGLKGSDYNYNYPSTVLSSGESGPEASNAPFMDPFKVKGMQQLEESEESISLPKQDRCVCVCV